MSEQQGLSLKPSDATSGGGLLDDSTVTFKECRAALWDYNGTIPTPVVALKVTMSPTPDGEGNQASDVIQYYSAGDQKNFVPSQDGRKFIPVGTATGLNEGCNAMLLILSLLNAVNGFPEDKISDDLGVFDGTVAYVKRVPQPKRAGLTAAPDKKGDGKILLVQRIDKLPWENPAKGGAGVGAKKAAAPKVAQQAQAPSQGQVAQAPAVSGDLNDQAVGALLSILGAKGGTVTKASIAAEAFKVLQKDPNRNEIMKLLYSDAFLGGEGVPWSFDGTTVKMG